MRKIHKGIMRWEDIENEEENNQTDNNGMSFVPNELLNNINNQKNIANNLETQVNPSTNEISNTNKNTKVLNNHTDKEGQNNEPYEIDEEEDFPVEIMNAPDYGLDFDEDDMNLEIYDVARDLKKMKPDI